MVEGPQSPTSFLFRGPRRPKIPGLKRIKNDTKLAQRLFRLELKKEKFYVQTCRAVIRYTVLLIYDNCRFRNRVFGLIAIFMNYNNYDYFHCHNYSLLLWFFFGSTMCGTEWNIHYQLFLCFTYMVNKRWSIYFFCCCWFFCFVLFSSSFFFSFPFFFFLFFLIPYWRTCWLAF